MSALHQAMLMRGGDPDYGSVVFGVNFGGLSDGTSSFTDFSPYSHSVTRLGNVVTAGGALSMDASDTANGITAPAGTWFDFGTGDLTWEAIVTRSGGGQAGVFSAVGSGYYFAYDSSFGGIAFTFPSGSGTAGSGAWGTSKIHVGVQRTSGKLQLLCNGTSYHNSTSNSGVSINMSSGVFQIGRRAATGTQFIGLIHQFRITKGVSRYAVDGSNNYTPPSLSDPFPTS